TSPCSLEILSVFVRLDYVASVTTVPLVLANVAILHECHEPTPQITCKFCHWSEPNTTALWASAISSAVAGRPAGAWAASCSSPSPMASVPSVRVGPGLTALTRTPLGPYSAAHVLVSRLMAALLEP